jgi:glycosyltransferase A (GT-A) superfamily protein (DUF2064 family)
MAETTNQLSVVVLDALGAPVDPGLDALLGADRARRLRAALLERALRWARAVAPAGAHHVAATGELARCAARGGAVLLVAPDVPGLDAALAEAVMGDLAAGCDVVLGAAHDARPYLVGLATLTPAGLALAGGAFEDGVLAAVARAQAGSPGDGLLGLLRSERRLASAGDVRALALDPLAPPELAALVRHT